MEAENQPVCSGFTDYLPVFSLIPHSCFKVLCFSGAVQRTKFFSGLNFLFTGMKAGTLSTHLWQLSSTWFPYFQNVLKSLICYCLLSHSLSIWFHIILILLKNLCHPHFVSWCIISSVNIWFLTLKVKTWSITLFLIKESLWVWTPDSEQSQLWAPWQRGDRNKKWLVETLLVSHQE